MDSSQPAIACGEAAFAFDGDFRVVAWNAEAERLTGLAAEDAIGQPCWQALRAVDPNGDVICHSRCPHARRARRGDELPSRTVLVPAAGGGRARVRLSTLTVYGREPLHVHVLGAAGQRARQADDPGPLTARQLEIITRLSEGRVAKQIAADLALAEPTVRNHIRDALRRLGAHSQLEAVATARRLGLVA